VKTVGDIFVHAQHFKRQGLDPWEITARILEIGADCGFRQVTEHSAGGGGQPITIELIFPNDEVIRFDGTDWYHRRRMRS
jgi:hypothetical protein